MKIVVCVKQVLSTKVPLEIGDTVYQKEPLPIYMMNPADRVALEKAVEMKVLLESAKITAITVGPTGAEDILRMALAGGADEAIHLVDDAKEISDAYSTALVLGKEIERLGYIAVFCGNRSMDMGAAQVPSSLAEILGIPQVTGVTALEIISEKQVRVWRRLDKGKRQILECSLPALFAADTLAGQPCYISVFAQMRASERELQRLAMSDLGMTFADVDSQCLTRVTRLTQPRPRTKRIYIPDSSMSASQRMSYLLSGGLAEKNQSPLLEGTADYLAQQILEYLKQEGLLP